MTSHQTQTPLYPLQFEPIYQYRLWGGRRLADVLAAPLPADGPIGEAWVLSDRDDHQSRVANGPLKGQTIGQLMEESPEQLMGKLAGRFRRFPLLLKFLDAREMLSVQVHPADGHTDLLPEGATGKTEAWVVLEAGTKSRIYAGLKPGTTAGDLRLALTNGAVADYLVSFTPKPGDAVFLPAGTVHSLGAGIVVFEVQENSDVRFRLYDWDHVDAKTGRPRALQVEQALACIDFVGGAASPVAPVLEATKRPPSARISFAVNISSYGACADTHRLPSARRVYHACWYASGARGRLSTPAAQTPSEKAKYRSCRRQLERALSGRFEQ